MLIGERKKLYQRHYMRVRRAKERLFKTQILYKANSAFVRPKTFSTVRPTEDADGNIIYDDL